MRASAPSALALALCLGLPACSPTEAEQEHHLFVSCGPSVDTLPGSAQLRLQVSLQAAGAACPPVCSDQQAFPLRIAWGDVPGIDETHSIRSGTTETIVHNFRATGTFNVRLAVVNAFNAQFFCSTTHEVRELGTPPTNGCSTYEDAFDTDARWIVDQDATDITFLQDAVFQGSGGNPGGFRRMRHVLPHAGQITVSHEHRERYDPAFSGAIARIRYTEDRTQFDPPAPNAAVAGGLWIGQRERSWRVPLPEFRVTRWERASVDVTAADLPGADLSARGAPLRLGYYRANSTGGAPFTLTHGIDNWRVEVCR